MTITGATLPMEMDAKRLNEDDLAVYFKIRMTREGVVNEALQTRDEVLRLIPFANGVPIVVEHPPDQLVIEDYSLIVGFTKEMAAAEVDGSLVVEGVAGIFKDAQIPHGDKGETLDVVATIEANGVLEVSYAFTVDFVDKKGELDGEKYTVERTNIMPQHLALLVESTPACALPHCGIGFDSTPAARKLFIEPGRFKDHHTKSHGETMSGENDKPEKPEVKKTTEQPIGVADMGLDALAEVSPCVKKLVDSLAAKKDELDKAQTAIAEAKVATDKLNEAKAELDAIRQKELDALREEVKAAGVVDEEELAKMDMAELTRMKAAIVKLAPDQVDKTGQVKFPVQKKEQSGAGMSVGNPDGEGGWSPFNQEK